MIKKKPYKHQQNALSWAGTRSGIALFMEMRLGKTLVAIRWANQFGLEKILVVCFLSCIYVWQEELACEGCSSTILAGSWKEKLEIMNEQDTFWYIANYESLYVDRRPKKPRPSKIALAPWDGVILDESTGIKNPRTIRTKMCRKYFKTTPYKGILTGLPNPEGPMDYFEQQAFVYGQFMKCKTYWQFRHKYFHLGYSDYDWVPNKKTLSAIKKEVNKNSFVLTRKQAGMGSKIIYEHRYVELPKKVRKEY